LGPLLAQSSAQLNTRLSALCHTFGHSSSANSKGGFSTSPVVKLREALNSSPDAMSTASFEELLQEVIGSVNMRLLQSLSMEEIMNLARLLTSHSLDSLVAV
jgi:hypothetical protein